MADKNNPTNWFEDESPFKKIMPSSPLGDQEGDLNRWLTERNELWKKIQDSFGEMSQLQIEAKEKELELLTLQHDLEELRDSAPSIWNIREFLNWAGRCREKTKEVKQSGRETSILTKKVEVATVKQATISQEIHHKFVESRLGIPPGGLSEQRDM